MLTTSLLPLSLAALVAARVHHSRVPEDPYAFPKYRVSFLNGLPVLNDTAERWLHDGLRGGELEFLDQPWRESHWDANPLKRIEGTDDRQDAAASSQASNYTLQQIKLGPKSSYLCLIPPPPQDPLATDEEPPAEVSTPVHSWSLLQPLAGTCLYFHELHHQHIPITGEYKPEEDPEWEAYTLGRAPPTLEAGAELTTAEAAAAANLELARGAGSRYLVQRWGDGRKREVEIQAGSFHKSNRSFGYAHPLTLHAVFHCSMTMTDTILFVKETQTCHYVLHIATPRLCGEPGFKSRIDAEEEHYIRCREVVGPEEYERVDPSLPAAAQPIKRPRPQKKVIAPPPVAESKGAGSKEAAKHPKVGGESLAHSEVLRRALEQLLARREAAVVDRHIAIEELPDGEGELLVEYIDLDIPEGEEGMGLLGELLLDGHGQQEGRLFEILRAAGFNVKGKKAGSSAEQDEDDAGEGGREERHRDEL
ncbi:hypothetical protein OH76DRAFT_1414157 [Lentinus brumalis]|uniref:Protein OS-9 homolog n=1 Tax=Lentinus brumalis TaxID=2498619 RepID=A0A371DVR9_9APHY|nr:hypothetical protein OH76DRAFT_1414157 [Polyporus brumalis]